MNLNEPYLLTATEAIHLIAKSHLTAEALVRSCLERIDFRESKVRAWAFLDPDLAIRRARKLDRLAQPAGPLHGIPIGVKDIIDTADMPTEYNSAFYRGHRPRNDAECIARLRAAGAIILGKTATSEYAGLSPAPTRNPYDPRYTPGGSSSGSAASVGDCMVPLALGSQTGGSTIRPASWCGAAAFKPSYARASLRGVKSLASSYDTLGLIARSIDDLALLDSVVAGEPPRALRPPACERLRIGYCATPFWDQADPSTRRATESTADALRKAGSKVERIDLPDEVVTLSDGFYIVVSAEAAWALGPEYDENKHLLSEQTRRMVEVGRSTKAEDVQNIRAAQMRCALAVDRLFDRCDVFLTPAAPGEAPRGRVLGNNEFNRMWTAMHLPCLAIPAGLGLNGLPVGIQLVGRCGSDRTLLAIGKRVEAVMQSNASEGRMRDAGS
jgi:Asp-tRNA(Asn)/Glu-tRNA(Gln) amidotransferase A subunit family amidase